jgi:6-phosphogluconolactonase
MNNSRQTPSVGIERCTFDDKTGVVRHVESVAGLRSPQFLEVHPTKPVLYAAEAARPGNLVTFSIRGDGSLEHRSSTSALGDLTVSVSVHPSKRFAYTANWATGNLTGFPLDDDGMVLDAFAVADRAQAEGSRPEDNRPHMFTPSPDGGAFVVAYSGPRDEVAAYTADADGVLSSRPVASVPFPAGSHPRHIAFDPSGHFVYVDGEFDSNLYVLEARDGLVLRHLAAHSTLPEGFVGTNHPSELVMHPARDTLYVGNRGADCITVFALDGTGGAKPIDHQPSLGEGPRAVRIDPSGRYLLVGHTESGSIVVFEIQDDRRLRPVGSPVPVPSPSSIVFQRAL